MKLLALDIETAPAVVYTFSLFKPMIGIEQIIEPSRIICVSYQWNDKKTVGFISEHEDGRDAMLTKLHELLDEADAVIHYNGNRFDMPWITGEFLKSGFPPPSPYKSIDLYQTVKSKARFISNKLDWVSQQLLGDRKVAHTGFKLWKDCLGPDGPEKEAAWKLMRKYSIQDTRLMFPLYEKLLPWIDNHPNVALYNGVAEGCSHCGSTDLQKRGYKRTGVSTFQQYRCNSCGRWPRGSQRLATTMLRSA